MMHLFVPSPIKMHHLPSLTLSLWLSCEWLLLLSLQSCPTLCDPIDGSPPGSSVPGILWARILEWVAISFSNACMHAKLLQLCPTLWDPMDSSPPGSSVHGILQARILEWVAISFSCEWLGSCISGQRPESRFFSSPLQHLVTVFFSPLWQRLLEHLQMQATVQQRARPARMRSQVGLRKNHWEQSYQRWWNSSWAISNPKGWCC